MARYTRIIVSLIKAWKDTESVMMPPFNVISRRSTPEENKLQESKDKERARLDDKI